MGLFVSSSVSEMGEYSFLAKGARREFPLWLSGDELD